MNILIFSDSHGRTSGMKNAIDIQPEKIDAVFFLGDGLHDVTYLELGDIPLYCVRGNCDYGALEPAEMVLDFEGHRLLLCHGHTLSAKSGTSRLLLRACEVGADIVVYGHTHTPKSECIPFGETIGNETTKRPIYLLNPGSIGYYGRSFGVLKITKNDVLFSHGEI